MNKSNENRVMKAVEWVEAQMAKEAKAAKNRRPMNKITINKDKTPLQIKEAAKKADAKKKKAADALAEKKAAAAKKTADAKAKKIKEKADAKAKAKEESDALAAEEAEKLAEKANLAEENQAKIDALEE